MDLEVVNNPHFAWLTYNMVEILSESVQWQNLFGESNFNDSFDSVLRQKSAGNSRLDKSFSMIS